MYTPAPFVPPSLDESTLAKMRAPPDIDDSATLIEENDSSSGEDNGDGASLPGTFPMDAASSNDSRYY